MLIRTHIWIIFSQNQLSLRSQIGKPHASWLRIPFHHHCRLIQAPCSGPSGVSHPKFRFNAHQWSRTVYRWPQVSSFHNSCEARKAVSLPDYFHPLWCRLHFLYRRSSIRVFISSPLIMLPSYIFTWYKTIIEADGVNTETLVADSIHIFTAQRYSIILEANQTIGNYWIRSQPVDTTVIDGINMAVLRYDTAPPNEPTTTSDLRNPMLETNLHPLENPGAPGGAAPGEVDVPLNLVLAFDTTNDTYTINGVSFIPPSMPVLLQILSGARHASELLPPGSVYVLPRNKTIEVTIPGGSQDPPVRNNSPFRNWLTNWFCSILSICMVYVWPVITSLR